MADFVGAKDEKSESVTECSICGSSFASRNKMFKHLKTGCHDADVLKEKDSLANLVFYATGGRQRGITLGSCERMILDSNGNGSWEAIESMTDYRGSHGCATVNGCLYILGGGGAGAKLNLATTEMYDPATGLWKYVAPMGTFRHALSVVVIGKLIYAIGGWFDGSVCSGDIEVYDTEANSWEFLAPMPVPRRLLGATAGRDGCIYVFGGNRDEKLEWYTRTAERYTPTTNTWKSLTDMPYDGGCSACSLSASSSDFIYVFVHGNCVLRYDTSADSYVELCKLPVKEWYTFDVCHAGERNKRSIIVFGGAICGKSADRVFKFDVLTLEWTELSKMTEKRRRLAACVCSFEADKTS
jgi:N-acetylneuraminic acid mutarotase